MAQVLPYQSASWFLNQPELRNTFQLETAVIKQVSVVLEIFHYSMRCIVSVSVLENESKSRI